MKKTYLLIFFVTMIIQTPYAFASTHQQHCGPQTKPIVITKSLVEKINSLERDSSNAHSVEKSIGPACACLTTDPAPTNEVWTCQWKNNFSSNGVENTLNITFAAGSISTITAIAADGTGYKAQAGEAVKVYRK